MTFLRKLSSKRPYVWVVWRRKLKISLLLKLLWFSNLLQESDCISSALQKTTGEMEMEKRQHSTASCKIGNEVHYIFNVLCVLRTVSEAKRRSVMF